MFMLFPCHTYQAMRFYSNQLPNMQEKIIACTSMKTEKLIHKYNSIVDLTNIYAPDFIDQFDKIVNKYQITALITDNDFVIKRLANHNYSLPIISIARDFYGAVNEFRDLKEFANNYYQQLQEESKTSLKITLTDIITILNQCIHIPGHTSLEKILSFIKIFKNLPEGDILEIGVFFGRSAVALGLLSRIYFSKPHQIYLADPWNAEHAIQTDSPELLISMAKEIDWNLIFERFKAEISSTSLTNYQIVRGTIEDLKKSILPKATKLGRFLSLAHIDGNHDYHVVKRDLITVIPWIKKHGMLICDDYKWIHGEGVRCAVHEILDEYPNLVMLENIIDNSAVIIIKE